MDVAEEEAIPVDVDAEGVLATWYANFHDGACNACDVFWRVEQEAEAAFSAMKQVEQPGA